VADPTTGILPASPAEEGRPRVRGKFIFVRDQKLYIRGVTYGPFRADEAGGQYHTPAVVDRDFAQMAARGINTVRCYTVPPRWLLDLAQEHCLWVMVGLPWEQHVTVLDDRNRTRSIEERVRTGVRACAGHPALLCYAIGNEIPAPIVRWQGRQRTERFLRRLYRAAKDEDSQALVTYVNYPTTEYLQLPFLDFQCFNVYLEAQDRLEAYLARLQNLAAEKPLVMAEIGLDSRRNGEKIQAEVLDWQVRTAFASGCAGAIVFSWTDEWHRGGHDIEDWDFGLTRRDRSPKPALAAVGRAFADVPFPAKSDWPSVSVALCSYNGAQTIGETLAGLSKLEYPDFEVIVVSDGSSDATAEIARQYDVRLITTENRGLSSARNTAMKAAMGEIVAYIDDDAYPDPHWLHYLADIFMRTECVGVGGPNLAPPGDGLIADCVDNAPGGPNHVLVSDRQAEHIPGCNMSFRKSSLQAVGGFDTQFRIAGDDVDLCWRLQERGWKLGFHPAAMVWHHRRRSVRAYLKQQHNYGKAEGMLEVKWPGKYNAYGHLTWQGRLYGHGLSRALMFQRWRIYHGVWGSRLFQSIYERRPDGLAAMLLMPEWALLLFGLAGLSLLGLFWAPLFFAAPLALLAAGLLVGQSIVSARASSFDEPLSAWARGLRYAMTVFLHLLQPLARLGGRLRAGLTPWRRRGRPSLALPWARTHAVWSERWISLEQRLESMEAAIRAQGAVVHRGGAYDRWDLKIRGGLFGAVRARATVEEHGGGKQLVRIHSWPWLGARAFGLILLFSLLAALAVVDGAWIAACILATTAMGVVAAAFADCAEATASFRYALFEGRLGSGQLVGAGDEPAPERLARVAEGTRPVSKPSVGVFKVVE
jgi:GT2 family glycosyltransferase